MAKKSIIWSNRAEVELKSTLNFYNLRNGNTKYSFKLLKQVNKVLDNLSENEFMGRLTEDKKTRVVVMGVYLIFYEIISFEIRIMSFWDNRQKPEKRIDSIKQ